MKTTVVFDKARRTWFLLDRHPSHSGGRKKILLGKTDADYQRGLAIAEAKNRERREAADAHGRLGFGGRARGGDALTAWWTAAKPGLADSTRVTVEGYVRLHLRPYFGETDLAGLTREKIRAFAGERADAGLGQHAIQGALSVLRRVLRWCVEIGVLERMPVERIVAVGLEAAAARGAQKGTREAYTYAEAEALLAIADTHLRPLVFAASQTGARKGELLALTWACVNFDAGEIEWRSSRWHKKTKATKANKVRRSAMSPELADLLRSFARERFATSEAHVFLARTGKPWNYSSLNTALRRFQKRAHAKSGVRPLPFHSWRHTFVSWALAGGADPLWVAAQIGDRPETMLRTYAHLLRGRAQPLDFLRITGATARPAPRPAEASAAKAARAARSRRTRGVRPPG